MLPLLDKRLMCAAELVRDGVRFADIGSDHAYLPIYLKLEGRISCALASDINEGPVASAVENIKKYGVADSVFAVMADGLDAARDFRPDDIAVLGMGGELIMSIIDKAQFVKDENIHLILQPMTHAEKLYCYLLENGFEIICERFCATSEKRGDRIYRVICARYCGVSRKCDMIEAMAGKDTGIDDPVKKRYIRHMIDVYNVRINGKKRACEDTAYEEELTEGLEKLL